MALLRRYVAPGRVLRLLGGRGLGLSVGSASLWYMCSIVRGPVGLLGVGLGALAEQDVAGLPVGEVRGQLIELLGQVSQLHAQVARRVAVFDAAGGGVVDAARTTKAWLRMVGRMSPSAASRLVNAARLLRDMPLLCAAAEDGLVSAEHVEKVVRLAERVSADVVAGVQEALTEVACRVDPGRLDAACARVRQHVDPDGPRPDPGVDFSRRGITLSRFDGMLLVRGQLDPEGGAAVLTALDALLTPPAAADDRSPAQRRADALVELARGALRAGRLPRVGGVRPQLGILVTPGNLMDQRNLMTSQFLGRSVSPGGLGPDAAVVGGGDDPLAAVGVGAARPAAWLDWLGDVPDEVAQRVGCDADVWRVVLDPASGRPVEVGRSHRLVPAWLRKALHARDRGCRFTGCDAPSAWTDGHHLQAWSRGGRTDLDNLISLCRWHHSRVHDGRWSIAYDTATNTVTVRRPDGSPFTPPGRRRTTQPGKSPPPPPPPRPAKPPDQPAA